jgi:hypothetical protein
MKALCQLLALSIFSKQVRCEKTGTREEPVLLKGFGANVAPSRAEGIQIDHW